MSNYLSNFASDDDDASGDIELLRSRLEYYFTGPMQKWRQRRTIPWKILIQILKIVVFTSQLILFGSDMAKFINYKEEMQMTLKQLFLRDWDPSADAIPYPGPYIPYAIYTEPDFVRSVNFAIRQYSNISQVSVGPFGYQSNKSTSLSPIIICATNYDEADFDPSSSSYNYSIYTNQRCKTIKDYADAGSDRWTAFDFRAHIDFPINFSSLVSMTLNLPLRTLLFENASTGDEGIVCFDLGMVIYYNNQHRNGQIIVSLESKPRRTECHGVLSESGGSFALRKTLNMVVIFFCLSSFLLCVRSMWRFYRLLKYTERVLKPHGRKLELRDKLEYLDVWLILIIVNDLMVGYATVIISFSDEMLLETNNYTICSILLGLGNFLSWSGLLRYLSFFEKYNLLIVTLRKSFLHVMRFMICTTLIYCGFCFCGWIVFGPYHYKFRRLSTTSECLFSLINGDDMFETFALLRSDIVSIWWFSRIYLYLFVSLFIYVVLSLFIALIMDAYEMIKQFGDNGFPKSRLESFYLDGDLTKLASALMSDSPSSTRSSRARLV